MTWESQHRRRIVEAESCSPVSATPNPDSFFNSSRLMVRVSRGTAPWDSGSTLVVWRRCLHAAGGVELTDHAELDCVEGGLQGFDLGDGVHQLLAGACGPQGVCELLNLSAHGRQLSRNTVFVVPARGGVRLGGHE